MAKKIFYAAALLLAFGLSSCSKDYTCTCTAKITDSGGTVVQQNATARVINGTKSKAEEECTAGNATSSAGGFTTTITCESVKK